MNEYAQPTEEEIAAAGQLIEEYNRKERERKQNSGSNEVVLDPASVGVLAQKVAEILHKDDPNASTLAEVRNLLAARERREAAAAEEKSLKEDTELAQSVIKEAGSSYQGLRDLIEESLKIEHAQVREEADANPPRKIDYPDPRGKRSGIFRKQQTR